ncbi:MAG: hypothetical protein DDT22_00075 [candidate division WS2 bacterium]|nr:hypothetical protein [Candidatus Lithacetigena glycinireducens]MBT9174422.1 hypothetical protein [Candidatus Lithacetigena glycinireducens]
MSINYEKAHSLFDGLMINICHACGGICEQNQLAVLLPEEDDYIALKIGVEKKEFLKNYCTTVDFREQKINILKIGVCPFLNNQFRCELEQFNCKALQCLLYPVLINSSLAQGKAIVDESYCPMAHSVSEEFKHKSWKLLEEIKSNLPQWWLDCSGIIDSYIYDYKKMSDLKNKTTITIEELNNCIIRWYNN